jgi:hypothetical protein
MAGYANDAAAVPSTLGANTPVVDTNGIVDYTNNFTSYTSATWNYSSFVLAMGGVANNVATQTNYAAVPYVISVSASNPSSALITICGNTFANQAAVVIPLCAITTGSSAITATIVSYTPEVTGTTVNLSTAGSTGCIMALDETGVVPAQYRINLGNVTITEQQLKLLGSGWFYIDAPAGYHFVNDSATSTFNGTASTIAASQNGSTSTSKNAPVTVAVTPQLYLSGNVGMAINYFAYRTYDGNSWDPGTTNAPAGVAPGSAPNTTGFYPSTANSRMYFYLPTLTSGSILGTVTLSGLIIAQDNPNNTAFNQTLSMNINDAAYGNFAPGIGVGFNGGAGVNTVSFTSRLTPDGVIWATFSLTTRTSLCFKRARLPYPLRSR